MNIRNQYGITQKRMFIYLTVDADLVQEDWLVCALKRASDIILWIIKRKY